MTWERGAISRIHWGSRLTVLISLWMDLTSGINIILNPQDPLVGQTVVLNVSDVTGRITSFTWYKGLNPNATNQIISYIPGLDPPQTKGDSYIENAQGYDNGSLQIPNLKKEYEGNYTVQIQAGTVQQASVYLPVQVSPNNNVRLSDGAIAGIVIGTIAGVLLLCGVVFLIYKYCVKKD